jgi:hypothetical protein
MNRASTPAMVNVSATILVLEARRRRLRAATQFARASPGAQPASRAERRRRPRPG